MYLEYSVIPLHVLGSKFFFFLQSSTLFHTI